MSEQNQLQLLEVLLRKATVEHVHGAGLNDPDWTSNFAIVDAITRHPKVASYVVKWLELQLKNFYDDPRVLWLDLILLETLAKNCGYPMHEALATKEFLYRLKKTAGKKISKPRRNFPKPVTARALMKERVQLKVLSLIQAWGPLHPNELQIFNQTFKELQGKGVQFPPPIPEDFAPLTEVQKAQRLRQSTSALHINEDLKQFFDEAKSTITLLESICEEMQAEGKEFKTSEIVQELTESLTAKRDKLVELIQTHGEGEDEKLISTMFILHERMENVVNKVHYGVQASAPGESSSEGEHSSEDLASPPALPPTKQSFLLPPSSSLGAKSAEDLGADLFRAISSVKKRKEEEKKESKDPFLDWLLSGVESKPSKWSFNDTTTTTTTASSSKEQPLPFPPASNTAQTLSVPSLQVDTPKDPQPSSSYNPFT